MPQELILTDAGWDRVSYEQACTYFSKEDVDTWWAKVSENWEVVDILREVGLDPALAEDADFLENTDILALHPAHLDLITARACYGPHRWLAILSLPLYDGPFFQQHEEQAIALGLALRDTLGLECAVVNDNKDAVRAVRQRHPDVAIVWKRRQFVRDAHALSLTTANRILVDPVYQSCFRAFLSD